MPSPRRKPTCCNDIRKIKENICSSSGVLLNASSIILTALTTPEESRYKLPGPAVRKGTRGPTMFHMFLSFLVLQLFVNLQIQPFRPRPSHSAIDSHSYRFRTQSFSRSDLNGGPENIFFSWARTHIRCPCILIQASRPLLDARPFSNDYCHALAWHSSVMPLTTLLSNQIRALINEYTNTIFCVITFKADSHIACRAHAVHLPCRAAKGLECLSHLIYTVRPCRIHTCHAVLLKATARPSRDGRAVTLRTAWS